MEEAEIKKNTPMALERACRWVLEQYPLELREADLEPLGNAGGLSGAQLWRVTTQQRLLCLRRWPQPHPTLERLRLIHAVLSYVQTRGFHLLPVPFTTQSGKTIVERSGHFWELTPWLAGQADYEATPTPGKVHAAMTVLAQFHLAAATAPALPVHWSTSDGLAERRQLIRSLQGAMGERLRQAIDEPNDWPELRPCAQRLLSCFKAAAPYVLQQLDQVFRVAVPLQACIRDVWHSNLLFMDDQVTGLVDFGALRQETVVADIARLLGSLVGDDAEGRQRGLRAYENVRPLLEAERLLLVPFDQSTVLLSGMNWLRWIYVEQRVFGDRQLVLRRLDQNLQRLAHLRTQI